MPGPMTLEALTGKDAGLQRSLPACVHVPERNIEAQRRLDGGIGPAPVALKASKPARKESATDNLTGGILMVRIRRLMADRHVNGGHPGNSG